MKTKLRRVMQCGMLVCITLSLLLSARAQTAWYVSTNGVGNGTSWALATNNLQGAIDLSAEGDTVWVSNGVYATGGRRSGTQITNRIVIDKAITVRSASNDPEQTIIQGSASSGIINHADAVRCVWLGDNAKLIGFSLMDGATMTNKHVWATDSRGGGALCQSSSAVLSNCVIQGNAAYDEGGGVRSGTLYDCIIMQNTSGRLGGGASSSTLYNSMIVSNSASIGGGCYGGTLTRCVIRENTGTYGAGVYVGTLYNCLILYNRSGWNGGGTSSSTCYNCVLYGNKESGGGGGGAHQGTLYNCISWNNNVIDTATYYNSCGVGNTENNSTTNNPMFYNPAAGDFRLHPDSPCIDTGLNQTWMSSATDFSGNPRILPVNGTVDMGAYEYDPSNPPQVECFVTTNGIGNGSSWAFATNSLQGAIDNVIEGGTVWVSNGVYATGGRPAGGTQITNRIVIDKAITVRSASNDPEQTIIQGAASSGITNHADAVRCVWIASNAKLIGFSLMGGATMTNKHVWAADSRGGGAFCQSSSAVLSNCVIQGSVAYDEGGGVYSGTLYDCIVMQNMAPFGGGGKDSTFYNSMIVSNVAVVGGGVHGGVLYNSCVLTNSVLDSTPPSGVTRRGGGTYNSTLTDCLVAGNAGLQGGGCYAGTLTRCVIRENTGTYGAGFADGTLYNCLIVYNRSGWNGGGIWKGTCYNSVFYGNKGGGGGGGGAHQGTLYNCLLYDNSGSKGAGASGCTLYNCTIADNAGYGVYEGTLYNSISWGNSEADYNPAYTYSCGEGYTGNNSISADPRFVNAAHGNYRLRGSSPCIDTGINQTWMADALDLDGQRRIFRGTSVVDMGAYEHEPVSTTVILR